MLSGLWRAASPFAPGRRGPGHQGRVGRQAGEFVAVHNITVDKGGNIYTAEVNTGQRVQKFRRIDMQN